METIGLVLVLAGLVVLAAAVVALRRLRREFADTEARAEELAERMNALPPELAKGLGVGARHVITVELLNLFELAHKENALTRPLTALTPRLLRDVVHRKLVGRVRESLAASGVEADVRVHRW
jgi:Na+-transporting methylmalonyl-CoA/oxaloacetate decarboxylase gamma subunit